MVRNFLLFLLIFINITSLQAKDPLTTQIASFNEVVKKAGTLDYALTCSSLTPEKKYKTEKSSVYSKFNKKTVELTVITEQYAQEVFNTLKQDEENSFNYLLDGCYARAMKMATSMEDMGIISGKAFIEGDLIVDTSQGEANWSYHVASLVLVKNKNKLIPTVFDPSLFDKPVSYTKWKALILKKKGSKLTSEYFTKRFNYDPKSRDDEMETYLEDELEDMKDALRTNRLVGESLQNMYGDE